MPMAKTTQLMSVGMVYFCMRVMLFFFKVSNFIALTKIFVKIFGVYESTGQRVNEWGGLLDFCIFRGLEDSEIRDFELLEKIGVNSIKWMFFIGRIGLIRLIGHPLVDS